MRGPRVRLTVKRLMVAVAVVALGSFLAVEPLVIVLQKCTKHGAQYRHHLSNFEFHRSNRDAVFQGFGGRVYDPKPTLSEADKAAWEWFDRRARHEEQLVRKYRRAMFFPWLPVAPDPPDPG